MTWADPARLPQSCYETETNFWFLRFTSLDALESSCPRCLYGKAANALLVLLLLLVPLYVFLDELISPHGYSRLDAINGRSASVYFVLAAAFLVLWPRMMAKDLPVERQRRWCSTGSACCSMWERFCRLSSNLHDPSISGGN